jgi:putative glutamine amidotransferase
MALIAVAQSGRTADYLESIRRAGGETLEIGAATEGVFDVLSRVDGLLLTGGGDVDPALYGEARHPTFEAAEPGRDEFEIALVRAALQANLPCLAICRGMQVLNVALGGALHAHLPDLGCSTVEHRLPERLHTHHLARVAPDSRLADQLGSLEVTVCSWHHQGIARLAPGLKAVAWADDGIIEAVEHESHASCIAVQWHPEMQLDDPAQQRLIRSFVRLATVSSP